MPTDAVNQELRESRAILYRKLAGYQSMRTEKPRFSARAISVAFTLAQLTHEPEFLEGCPFQVCGFLQAFG